MSMRILKFLLIFLTISLFFLQTSMQTSNAEEKVSYGYINIDFEEKNETISVIEGYTIENNEESNITDLAFHLPSQIVQSCSVIINGTPSQPSQTHQFGRMLILNLS
ncbi:MAG: hypothetical protein QXT63_06815, partial [Thermoplasmata archaeon]